MAAPLKSLGVFGAAGINQTAVAMFEEVKVYWLACSPWSPPMHYVWTLHPAGWVNAQHRMKTDLEDPHLFLFSVAKRSKETSPAAISCSLGICLGNASAKASETSCCGKPRFEKTEN